MHLLRDGCHLKYIIKFTEFSSHVHGGRKYLKLHCTPPSSPAGKCVIVVGVTSPLAPAPFTPYSVIFSYKSKKYVEWGPHTSTRALLHSLFPFEKPFYSSKMAGPGVQKLLFLVLQFGGPIVLGSADARVVKDNDGSKSKPCTTSCSSPPISWGNSPPVIPLCFPDPVWQACFG